MPLVAWGPSNHRATNNHIATLNIRSCPVCASRAELLRISPCLRGREKRRHFFDRSGEVVQAAVRVPSGEDGRTVSGQFLKGAQVDAGAAPERQVGMAQRVEVGEQRSVWSFDGVGNASHIEVTSQHLGAAM